MREGEEIIPASKLEAGTDRPGGDKRYIRRDASGRIKERALSQVT
jgi:hypothetical protein